MLSVATPLESSGAVARIVAPSRNSTGPVGTLAGDCTLAVSTTGDPSTTGDGADTSVIVGVAFAMLRLRFAALVEYKESPPYDAEMAWAPPGNNGWVSCAAVFPPRFSPG